MFRKFAKDNWDRFRSDSRWAVKFVVISLVLCGIGKLMMIVADDKCDLSPILVQFVPTLPMFGLTFLAQRYLWGRQEVSVLSYVGAAWTSVYAVKTLIGHGAYTMCTEVFGWQAQWQYLTVSVVIGMALAIVTFVLNELILGRRDHLKITVP